jgi:hypothetical protein
VVVVEVVLVARDEELVGELRNKLFTKGMTSK